MRLADHSHAVRQRRARRVGALAVERDPDALLRDVPAVRGAAHGVDSAGRPATVELQLVDAVVERPADVPGAERVACQEAGAEEAARCPGGELCRVGRNFGSGSGGCAQGEEEEGLNLHREHGCWRSDFVDLNGVDTAHSS